MIENSDKTQGPYEQTASRNLLCGSGNLKQGSVSTWKGGMGEMGGRLTEGEGIHGYLWLIHVEA